MISLDSRPAVRLPPGVRDFLPRAAARRRAIAERLLGEFEIWGYSRIITPIFECADVLERGLGQDAREAAIRFVEPGTGEIVALRPDITPQVARMAATRMADVEGPLRLCYEGAVTRMSQGPRSQREILQAGVELISAESPDGDAEVITLAAHALATMGIDHIRLDVGHVAPARYALTAVPDAELRHSLALLLAKKDRAGVAELAKGLPRPLRELLSALPTLWGPPDKVLAAAGALPWPDEVKAALRTVKTVLAMTAEIVRAELHAAITMDLGEVRGFDYYTGIRFAGYADGVGDAVLLGGRYDELMGRYGRPAAATGFAVDIEAIAQAQSRSGVALQGASSAVLITAASKGRRRDGARIAAALRAHGQRAALDLGAARPLAAKSRYARSAGFSHLLILGRQGGELLAVTDGTTPPKQAIDERAVAGAIAGDCRSLLNALTRTRTRR